MVGMIEPLKLTAGGRLHVRPAEVDDAPFARALYLATGKPLLRAIGKEENRLVGRFRAVYKRRESWILGDGQDNIGWLQIAEGRRQVALRQLYLVASHRNRGIGTAVIRELQDQAARQGKAVVLRVLKGNPAAALYRRLGFVAVRETDEWFDMRWRLPESRGRAVPPGLLD